MYYTDRGKTLSKGAMHDWDRFTKLLCQNADNAIQNKKKNKTIS